MFPPKPFVGGYDLYSCRLQRSYLRHHSRGDLCWRVVHPPISQSLSPRFRGMAVPSRWCRSTPTGTSLPTVVGPGRAAPTRGNGQLRPHVPRARAFGSQHTPQMGNTLTRVGFQEDSHMVQGISTCRLPLYPHLSRRRARREPSYHSGVALTGDH